MLELRNQGYEQIENWGLSWIWEWDKQFLFICKMNHNHGNFIKWISACIHLLLLSLWAFSTFSILQGCRVAVLCSAPWGWHSNPLLAMPWSYHLKGPNTWHCNVFPDVIFTVWMTWSLRRLLLLNRRKIVTLAQGPGTIPTSCYWLEMNAGQSGCKSAGLIFKLTLQDEILQEVWRMA